MRKTKLLSKKYLKLHQREIFVIAIILILFVGLITYSLIHNHSKTEAPTVNQTATVEQSQVTTGNQLQNKYKPQLMQVGQIYYDSNHLISYSLKSIDAGYVDPKLQKEEYCPEYQKMQSQGSHIVEDVSCTITSKLLTWEFTNTSDKTVDVPGVYKMYDCKESSSSADNSLSTPSGYSILSEGYDPGPEPNGSMYWASNTSYPEDPANTLSASNILTNTLVDTIYQPKETKIVKSELGHNCTAVGESILGGSYEGWKI